MAAVAADGKTLVGPAAAEEGELAGAAARARAREAERRRAALGGAAAREPARKRARRRRAVLTALAAVAVAAGVAVLAVWGVRQVYFLGGDSAGRLALYRGLPYELPLGIKLYSEVYAAPVQVSSVPPARRDSATDHTLRLHGDAVNLVRDLEHAAEPPVKSKPSGKRQAASGKQRGGGKQGAPSGGGHGQSSGGGG